MSALGMRRFRPSRFTVALGLVLCLGLSLFAFSSTLLPKKAGAICDPRYWAAHHYCHPIHRNFDADNRDFSLYGGGPRLKGLTLHVNGGFVKMCWLMRSDAYSRVRMAAQLWNGTNKNTAEKIIDNRWRLYCDAATAKTHNILDVEAWLRHLDGYPVRVSQVSAETVSQGR